MLWAGPDAVTGWSRANTLVDVRYPDGAEYQHTYTATAGEYIPGRVICGQTGGPFLYSVGFAGPQCPVGVVYYPCNASKAPPFAPVGGET